MRVKAFETSLNLLLGMCYANDLCNAAFLFVQIYFALHQKIQFYNDIFMLIVGS